MASRFASISEKEIHSMNEDAVPKNTKMATKFGVTVFNGKLLNLISPASYSKAKKSKYNALIIVYEKLSSTKIPMKTAWFQKQEEFNSTTEEMTPQQVNKCEKVRRNILQ